MKTDEKLEIIPLGIKIDCECGKRLYPTDAKDVSFKLLGFLQFEALYHYGKFEFLCPECNRTTIDNAITATVWGPYQANLANLFFCPKCELYHEIPYKMTDISRMFIENNGQLHCTCPNCNNNITVTQQKDMTPLSKLLHSIQGENQTIQQI